MWIWDGTPNKITSNGENVYIQAQARLIFQKTNVIIQVP